MALTACEYGTPRGATRFINNVDLCFLTRGPVIGDAKDYLIFLINLFFIN